MVRACVCVCDNTGHGTYVILLLCGFHGLVGLSVLICLATELVVQVLFLRRDALQHAPDLVADLLQCCLGFWEH